MKKTVSMLERRGLLKAAAAGGAALALANSAGAAMTRREGDGGRALGREIPFDQDWLFHLGNDPKADRPEFDDSNWRKLDLPHDWSIEDRAGAPKTTDPWVPPVALWNPTDHPADAQPVSDEVPIVMASVHPTTADGPPRKVGPFDVDATAFGWGTGWTVGGTGWYRKHFLLGDLAPGEQVEIRFDGAYMVSDVWLNGVWLGRNVNGYLDFAFDLTPHLVSDRPNILAVRVANEGQTARWYSGSGIYRHVWLNRTGAVRLPGAGVAVTTMSADHSAARIGVAAEVENRSTVAKDVECRIAVRDRAGREVAATTKKLTLAAGAARAVNAEFALSGPALWSPEAPNLYEAEVSLTTDGKTTDRLSQRFGIRTIEARPDKGLLINGKVYQLQGACLHHDNGILGAVAIDRAERRKVELVKANGFNAIRCSHNPPSPHFLDVCDELGMIVMDEAFDMWEEPKLMKDAYHRYFAENWRKDLATMIRRDRNHPSIIFWSIGNEIAEAIKPRGVELAGQMRALILEHDKTRFITHALTASFSGAKGEGARKQLDVTSYNYSFHAVEKDHGTYPALTFTTTETHSADAYDVKQYMDRIPAYMGEFLWTGIDYIGEVGSGSSRLRSDKPDPAAKKKIIFGMDVSHLNFYVWDYPAYQSGSGEIDLIGLRKPPSYYRDVVWGRSKLELFVQRPTPPGFHEEQTAWGWPDELMSWTWSEAETQAMTVRAYSSGDEVALLLNGKEVGRKALADADKCKAQFTLGYQPGELTAVAYAGGREIGRKTLATAGAPAQLRLRADRTAIAGNADDLAYVYAEVLDAKGRLVPDAAIPLRFSVKGSARMLAAGSANPYGIESFQDGDTRSFHGAALTVLQATRRRGEAQVRVSSPGLKDAKLVIRAG